MDSVELSIGYACVIISRHLGLFFYIQLIILNFISWKLVHWVCHAPAITLGFEEHPGGTFSVIHIGWAVIKALINGAAYGRFSVYQVTCEWVSLWLNCCWALMVNPPGVSTVAYRVCGVMMALLNGTSSYQWQFSELLSIIACMELYSQCDFYNQFIMPRVCDGSKLTV